MLLFFGRCPSTFALILQSFFHPKTGALPKPSKRMHTHKNHNKNENNHNNQPVRQLPNPDSPYKSGMVPVPAKHRNVDRSAARNKALAYGQSPLPIAQGSTGGYYSRKGKYLGSHDQANDTIYLVTNKKERNAIKDAHKHGACMPLSEVRSAVVLPSFAVRQAMLEAVKRSNKPNTTVGDKKGGFHEEGGMFGLDNDGNENIVEALPGKYADPSKVAYASVDVFSGESSTDNLKTIHGTYHVHPKGTIMGENGLKHEFDQAPSNKNGEGDIPNARERANPDKDANPYHVTGNSYVLGAGNKTVYIYNGNGVVATMPLKHFVKIK
ncbi:hypothetical protein M23134_04398 [Microscilla marina ATCC 23134]|uniref:Uncharacterized protein n=2 Tax=Microscilla marina TaxID=1027 RepID=A1ZM19_MICM2|nr:hypothetical protein M23134_04398 [Microscilla marina ATCC 23134]